MAGRRSRAKKRAKKNNKHTNQVDLPQKGGFDHVSRLTQETGPLPDDGYKRAETSVGAKRSEYTIPPGSARFRHTPNLLDEEGRESSENALDQIRSRHSLLPQAFEFIRLERWLNKGDGKQIEWAAKYLHKAFEGFPLPEEIASNREAVEYWFGLFDVPDAVKAKLFGQMTNAWNQKVKRAKRKADGVHSVELSARRMRELKSMARDAEITVTEALNEVVRVAYENKKEFRRQSAKVKKEALEKMRLEARGVGS